MPVAARRPNRRRCRGFDGVTELPDNRGTSYTACAMPMTPLNATVAAVTDRIRRRSADTRADYLGHVDALRTRARGAERLGCANVAHAFAALPANDKLRVVAERAPHIGIV